MAANPEAERALVWGGLAVAALMLLSGTLSSRPIVAVVSAALVLGLVIYTCLAINLPTRSKVIWALIAAALVGGAAAAGLVLT